MDNIEIFKKELSSLRGKTIAIVYIFEGEKASGFKHYWVWKSDIISGWLKAVQEIGCLPFILDVRTFVQKAINNTLPHIDFVLNLNCGSYELSSMSLIPSMCSFLSIPCIPCDAAAIVMSENKLISNLLALSKAIEVPDALNKPSDNGVYRPLNLGSSIGIQVGKINNWDGGTYQEFILGYDATLPIVYNPIKRNIDLFPLIIYLPKSKNPRWIYDAEEKEKDNGFDIIIRNHIDDSIKDALVDFAKVYPITTFGRIDFRIKSTDKLLSDDILSQEITMKDLFFVEMNSMPTIEPEDSFEFAMKNVLTDTSHSFFDCVNTYMSEIPNGTINGFLLSCSMLSLNK